jgi:hypothetical protein
MLLTLGLLMPVVIFEILSQTRCTNELGIIKNQTHKKTYSAARSEHHYHVRTIHDRNADYESEYNVPSCV